MFGLTSIYMVMSMGRPSACSHALIDAVAVVLLWEALHHVLIWYFVTPPQVGKVHGSLTTSIAVLLSQEMAATLLLGAPMISEYEHLRAGASATDSERAYLLRP